MSFDTSK